MPPQRTSYRNPRATRSCARCRRRKTECDLVYPQCGTCVAANSNCIGFNSVTGKEQPRSLVSFLEDKATRLEIELASLRTSDAAATPNSLMRALTLSNYSELADQNAPWSWRAAPYLSPSQLPTLGVSMAYEIRNDANPRSRVPRQKRDIASIPRNVLDIMIKHYSETHLVQYPIFKKSELMEQCDRVCNRTATAFDNYVVCMALSISAHTLIHHDQTRATKAADEFWESAILDLDEIWKQSLFTQLQAIMLLCHYGFMNPSAVSSIACSQATMALCIHLGLHREPIPESGRRLLDVENQRRIFWTCYTLNAQNQMLMGKALDIDKIEPSTKYPAAQTALPDHDRIETASCLYAFRQLESEITLGLFHGAHIDETDWLGNACNRAQLWREHLELQDFASKVEFREVMFPFQRLRLNRPSPRSPRPPNSMHRESIAAATFLATHYTRVMQKGEFFYWHHACWHLFEMGIVLADAANSGLDLIWRHNESFIMNEATEITSALRSIPLILRWMKHRWPQVESVAIELDQVFEPVLDRLDKWANGAITPPLDETLICAMNIYLIGKDWKQLESEALVSSDPAAMSEILTMEEVFRVLQPETSLPQLPDVTTVSAGVVPEPKIFDSVLSSNGLSPTDDALFWHSGGLELDDLFTALMLGVSTDTELMSIFICFLNDWAQIQT